MVIPFSIAPLDYRLAGAWEGKDSCACYSVPVERVLVRLLRTNRVSGKPEIQSKSAGRTLRIPAAHGVVARLLGVGPVSIVVLAQNHLTFVR